MKIPERPGFCVQSNGNALLIYCSAQGLFQPAFPKPDSSLYLLIIIPSPMLACIGCLLNSTFNFSSMEHVSCWKWLNKLSCSWWGHQQQRLEENILPVWAWLLNSDPYADALLTNQPSIRLISATSKTCCVHHFRAWKSTFIIKSRSILFILHHSQNLSWQFTCGQSKNLLFNSAIFQVPKSVTQWENKNSLEIYI